MVDELLPPVIARLYRRHPRLVIHVKQTVSGAPLYQDLRERNVDFLVGQLMSRTVDKDLNAEILFDENLLVVAGRQSPWASRRRIALAELLDQPWVMPPGHTTVGALFADAFHASGLEAPQVTVVCSSLQMSHTLLTTGPFLAMYPRSVLTLSTKRSSLKILPVRLSVPPEPVGIVTLKGRTPNPAAGLFIDAVRTMAKPLAKPR